MKSALTPRYEAFNSHLARFISPLCDVLLRDGERFAYTTAVREALDFSSTSRALAVCTAGWLFSLVLALIAGIIYGPVVH